jgi:hypothetical protein
MAYHVGKPQRININVTLTSDEVDELARLTRMAAATEPTRTRAQLSNYFLIIQEKCEAMTGRAVWQH